MNTTTTSTQTTAEANVAAVQGLYAAFGRGDMDHIMGLLADDLDWGSESASFSAPWYGRYTTKSDVAGFFQQMITSIDVTDLTLLSITSNETDVMVVMRWAFTAKTSGTSVEMDLYHWWRFDDGKVVFYRSVDDSELTASAFE